MNKKYSNIINSFEDFDNTYKHGFIGIPKGFGNLKESYFGTLKKFKKLYPNFKSTSKIPTVLFMHGSAGLRKGSVYRKWIVEEAGFIFFAPNSLKVKNRPTYETPTKLKNYEKVHDFRQAEIYFNLEKLQKISFIDTNNIFLMGNSEGGLAAAAFKGREFKGRIVTAYSCENAYYSKNFEIGANKNEAILNIIGTHDEYFSNDSKATKNHEVDGHCTKALRKYKNAKVIILPQTKHDITTNVYVKGDILNFLKLWSKE
ncbi:alpha/beta hydrolase family protein [Poseidonibacter sp.]|uniref:alpha/beta hydrolase family protein n=1 Tax=Poseidonibacter sp. TaxID=2321188 RepID=UPI003C77C6C9